MFANREVSNEMRKSAWNHKLRRNYPDLPDVAELAAGIRNPPVYPVREDLQYGKW